ncbi:MAG: hypothetical protein U1D30_17715 [Planctomycetota bacterium]
MVSWTDLLNMILAGVALGCILWGFRQRSLLQRVRQGLIALKQGRKDLRLKRFPEDRESVLAAFDTLAEQWTLKERDSSLTTPQADLTQVLNSICATLRPPLVSIQSYASLLQQDQSIPWNPAQRECLQNLHLQVKGLMRLLESSADLSELRHGLSGLRREIMASSPAAGMLTILLVDDEGVGSDQITDKLGNAGYKVLRAPGADAACIMARTLQPKLILIHGTRQDGLGWRVLQALKKIDGLREIPIWIYALNDEGLSGRLWTPERIWLWPPSESTTRAIHAFENSANPPVLHGDATLVKEIAAALPMARIEPEGSFAPTFEAWATLVASPHGDGPALNYYWFFSEAVVAQRAGELTAALKRSVADAPASLDDLQEELIKRLEASGGTIPSPRPGKQSLHS